MEEKSNTMKKYQRNLYLKNLPYKIYNNPSKSMVIGRCGGNEKTPNDHAEPTNIKR